MDDVIRLGGNIELSGVDKSNQHLMFVLKKILGDFAQKLNLDRLLVYVDGTNVSVSAVLDNQTIKGDAETKNVLMSVGDALREIEKQL